ncbi:MAG: hypothetical protein WCJ30_09045 [Deltaproteobacteria bacterium]
MTPLHLLPTRLARAVAPFAWAFVVFACDRAPHPGNSSDAQDLATSTDVQGTADVATPDVTIEDVAVDALPVGTDAIALDALDGFVTDASDAASTDAGVDALGADDALIADAADVPDVASGPMPDFTLPDVNPNSATFGTSASPRDHLGQVSAWYFGHST